MDVLVLLGSHLGKGFQKNDSISLAKSGKHFLDQCWCGSEGPCHSARGVPWARCTALSESRLSK